MSEMGSDDDENEVEMPDDGSEEAETDPEVLLEEPAVATGEDKPRPINLKAPVPVKKGPGRPKRSARQREARKRQKRAWVRQEAQSRIEVKRLERLARARGETLVKGDE